MVLIFAFAGLGGTAAIVPAVLPTAVSRSPAHPGAFLQAGPAMFTGLLVGVLLSTALSRGMSTRAVVAVGSLVQAGALTALSTMPSAGGFVLAAGGAGLGFGLVEAAGSALIRESAASVTRLLAGLTGTVALIAAACPLIVAFLPLGGAPVVALLVIAAIHLVTLVSVATTTPRQQHVRSPGAAGQPHDRVTPPVPVPEPVNQAEPRRTHPIRVEAAVAVALALYVGVESVFSGWSAVIAADLLSAGAQGAAVGTSAFWILMAAGRFAAWRVLRSQQSQTRQLLVALTGAAALLLLAATVGTPLRGVVLCAAIVFLGPCYSIILGIGMSRVSVADAARITGPLVASGALGGASIPWLVLAFANSPTSRTTLALSATLLLLAEVLLLIRCRRADHRGLQPLASIDATMHH